MSHHSEIEKIKKAHRCKDCGEVSLIGFPYYTWGRCLNCAYHKNKKNRLAVAVEKACRQCGLLFKPYKSTQVFCSKKCFLVSMSKARQGEGNPAYRNGTRVGGKNVNQDKIKAFVKNGKILKQRIINAKGCLQCEICSTNNTLRWEVHHIIYRSEAPEHESLHSIKNLVLCCISCHNWLHAQKDRRNGIVRKRRLWKVFPEYIRKESFLKSSP